jgi:hypothetical protein
MGMKICIVTAKDLILSKIIWIQELQIGIQKEDIRTLARQQILTGLTSNTGFQR